MTVGGIDTNDFLWVTFTRGELAVLGIAWHVVITAKKIVSVLTVVGRRDRVVACLETELVATNKGIPVEYLGELAIDSVGGTVRVDYTTERVTLEIGTMGVEFTALVGRSQAKSGVIDEADDLDVA